MTYSSKVVADSISQDGVRLTTLEVCFPRPYLAEFNTHRDFSRNSASSRAIPVAKQIERVRENPYVPLSFGKNQPGMQASEELSGEDLEAAISEWLLARDRAVDFATSLMDLGVHKQTANRLLEPFMWHTVIVSATEWGNFFGLRRSEMAQPEIHKIADLMFESMEASEPSYIGWDGWHLPYISEEERITLPSGDLVRISSARCARVSYLTHDGVRDISKDLELFERLAGPGHMSPMEHPAKPVEHHPTAFYGNFKGWKQFRKFLPHESDFSLRNN